MRNGKEDGIKVKGEERGERERPRGPAFEKGSPRERREKGRERIALTKGTALRGLGCFET